MHYVRCFCKERLRYGGGIIMTSEIYEALHAEIYELCTPRSTASGS